MSLIIDVKHTDSRAEHGRKHYTVCWELINYPLVKCNVGNEHVLRWVCGCVEMHVADENYRLGWVDVQAFCRGKSGLLVGTNKLIISRLN